MFRQVTSRALHATPGRIRRATIDGPIAITERGSPTHVLLTIADYHRLTNDPATLADAAPEVP